MIVFVHLLNDHSGSPKVLRESIRAVCNHNIPAKLYVGSSGEGVLSSCGIPISCFWYRRTGIRVLTLFTYFASQLFLFCQLLVDKSIANDAVIYINTLLPFGAALYGKMTGRRVIYHVHEISVTPKPLKLLLTSIARLTSSLNLYVSDTHMKALPLAGPPAQRVHNALDETFLVTAKASPYKHQRDGFFTVLMVASLRDYKGVREFFDLASSLVEQGAIRFVLVVNDEMAAIKHYFLRQPLPANLTVHPRTSETASFYSNASLVLNLSRVDHCVETFGLTILEAMSFGIPVIVPPIGGPTELVTNGSQGYWVDSRDRTALRERVQQLYADQELCKRMSRACRERASEFSPENFARTITEAISQAKKGDTLHD